MLRKPLVNSSARKPCTTQKAFSRVPLLFANSKGCLLRHCNKRQLVVSFVSSHGSSQFQVQMLGSRCTRCTRCPNIEFWCTWCTWCTCSRWCTRCTRCRYCQLLQKNEILACHREILAQDSRLSCQILVGEILVRFSQFV